MTAEHELVEKDRRIAMLEQRLADQDILIKELTAQVNLANARQGQSQIAQLMSRALPA